MDKTFGELSIDEKLELHRSMYEGRPVQYWAVGCGMWRTKFSSEFNDHLVYRTTPEPETDIELPWHVISPEYKWAAKDADGFVWVYEEEPSLGFDVWRSHGWSCTCKNLIHKPGNKPWEQSLIKRPEGV